MANIKISQLPAKGANLGAQDLVEVAEFTGTGYVSKSITGQEIIDAASGGGVAWGDITGTLSTQTDLQTALDAKQDDLVSGTNIKTINGSSVLGSGDLVVGGGGGVQLPLKQGYKYPNQQVSMFATNGSWSQNNNLTASNLRLTPFIPANSYTFYQFDLNVATAAALATFRVSIYSDNNGVPHTKLYESTDISAATTGQKMITTTFTFQGGTTYWIGVFAGGSGTITFSGVSQNGLMIIYQNGGATYTCLNTFAYTYGTTSPSVIDPVVANFSGGNLCPQVNFWKQ